MVVPQIKKTITKFTSVAFLTVTFSLYIKDFDYFYKNCREGSVTSAELKSDLCQSHWSLKVA